MDSIPFMQKILQACENNCFGWIIVAVSSGLEIPDCGKLWITLFWELKRRLKLLYCLLCCHISWSFVSWKGPYLVWPYILYIYPIYIYISWYIVILLSHEWLIVGLTDCREELEKGYARAWNNFTLRCQDPYCHRTNWSPKLRLGINIHISKCKGMWEQQN